ncbi:hypothetical protein MHYP_G00082440 [Metynnis hypsauchen]
MLTLPDVLERCFASGDALQALKGSATGSGPSVQRGSKQGCQRKHKAVVFGLNGIPRKDGEKGSGERSVTPPCAHVPGGSEAESETLCCMEERDVKHRQKEGSIRNPEASLCPLSRVLTCRGRGHKASLRMNSGREEKSIQSI